MTADGTAGIDLGGTKCLGVVVGPGGEIRAEEQVPTPAGTTALVDELAALFGVLAGRAGPVAAAGVGAPGLVDRAGILRFAPNLAGVADVPLREALEERLGVPVAVDNDATCAAWGERQRGAARSLDDVVMVTLGTGIGGGLVTGGRLHRGANGFAGEVGHMIVDPSGPLCSCGQRGCWERLGSGSALARLGQEAARAGRLEGPLGVVGGDPARVRGEHVAAAARDGDPQAREVVGELAGWVALGMVNLANVFDPEAIVVGGGLIEMGDVLLGPVRERFDGMLFAAEHRAPVQVLQAALGPRAGALGAADLARGLL